MAATICRRMLKKLERTKSEKEKAKTMTKLTKALVVALGMSLATLSAKAGDWTGYQIFEDDDGMMHMLRLHIDDKNTCELYNGVSRASIETTCHNCK